MSGVGGPTIVAVTGDPAAFEEDLIRRRLLEAGADHFIYRDELDRRLDSLVAGDVSPDPLTAPAELPELGITPPYPGQRPGAVPAGGGRRPGGIEEAKAPGRASPERGAGQGEAHAGELNPVSAEGGLAGHGEQPSPGLRQYRRILERATRLSGRGRRPG